MRVRKKVAATARIIAATAVEIEMKTSVVELDFAGGLGSDGGGTNFGAVTMGSAAGTEAAGGGVGCAGGGSVRSLLCGGVRSGTLPDGLTAATLGGIGLG